MNTEQERTLLPCPFCGGPASIRGDIGLQYLGCADQTGECAGANIALPCYRPESRTESIKRWNRRAAHAHEAAPEQAGVPGAWRLVPVEPTPAMRLAGSRDCSARIQPDQAGEVWRAMLSAVTVPAEYAFAATLPTQQTEQPVAPEDYKIPCDVMLPPATRIKRGCSLNTLIVAMAQRESLPPAQRVFAAAMVAQKADDARDAERYRWLRDGASMITDLNPWEDVGFVCAVFVCTEYGSQTALTGEDLDAAIDAELAKVGAA